MKSIFEASTAVEAHMIANFLEQVGIDATIEGEHLQGAVGELHAIGVVRVIVDDSDYQKANEIISNWESQQPEALSAHKTSHKSQRSLSTFLVGLLLGIAGMFWFYKTPITKEGMDLNGDGKNEVMWSYEGNRIARSESDRNRDGSIDQIDIYDRRGIISYSQVDDDFDGIYETKYKYRYGVVRSSESDFDQDGEIDYRITFKFGVVDEIDLIDSKTGDTRKKQKYELGKLKSADYDVNGDGEFDLQYEYDVFEEISRIIQ